MASFKYFKPKTIFVTCYIHSWYVLLVLGGCRRTNPGWISLDDKVDDGTETKHLTVPLISFMPGNTYCSIITAFFSGIIG